MVGNIRLKVKKNQLSSNYTRVFRVMKLVHADEGLSSNREISPLYQAIRDIDKQDVPFGEPSGIRTHDQEIKSLLLYH